MSSNFNDVVKQGSVRLKSKTLGVWQKRWLVLKRESSKGKPRLERYAEERHVATGQGVKVVELVSLTTISRLPKFGLLLIFKDGTERQLVFDTVDEQCDWETELHSVHLEIKGRVDPAFNNNDTSPLSTAEKFHVYLLPTLQLQQHGECVMAITAEDLLLLDVHNHNEQIASWPLNALRRYGRDTSNFTFEAGRFCDTGEGLFIFNTLEGEEIYQRVHAATLAIAEAHRIFTKQQSQKNQLEHSLSVPLSPVSSPLDKAKANSFSGKSSVDKPLPALPDGGGGRRVPPPRSNKPLPPIPVDDTPYMVTQQTPVSLLPPPPRIPPPPIPTQQPDASPNMPRHAPEPPPRRLTAQQGATANAAYGDLDQPIAVQANGKSRNEDYIYEERGLDPAFREFLAQRKQDSFGNLT